MVLIHLYKLSDTPISNTIRSNVTEQKSVLNTGIGSDGLTVSMLPGTTRLLSQFIYLRPFLTKPNLQRMINFLKYQHVKDSRKLRTRTPFQIQSPFRPLPHFSEYRQILSNMGNPNRRAIPVKPAAVAKPEIEPLPSPGPALCNGACGVNNLHEQSKTWNIGDQDLPTVIKVKHKALTEGLEHHKFHEARAARRG